MASPDEETRAYESPRVHIAGRDAGSCNFCVRETDTVAVVTASDECHGPRLQVRFCRQCWMHLRGRIVFPWEER